MCINENVAKNDIEYEKEQYISNKKEYINSIFFITKKFRKNIKKIPWKIGINLKKIKFK